MITIVHPKYIITEKTVTCDDGHNGHSTTIAENTTTDHTESTTEPKDVNLYTQPFRNIPGIAIAIVGSDQPRMIDLNFIL